MADLEARREARRQRILQASQDRMNRVLGKSGKDDTSEQVTTASPWAADRETIIERNVSEKNVENKEPLSNDAELRQRQNVSISDSYSQNTDSDSTNRQTVRNTVKISPLKKAAIAEKSTPSDESLNVSRSSSESKMMLKHFEFLRIVLCFMVGFLCRKVLSSGYGVLYVQSIVLPFLSLEAGFFMFKQRLLHNIVLPHRSSLLIGLLMLCGIKLNILMMYNKIMGYVTAASEDFAMFLFAFLMCHIFV